MTKELTPWQSFKNEYDLDDQKLGLFIKFIDFLDKENQKTNLTGLAETADMINYHLKDSLSLMKFEDLSEKTIVDIGSGAGFPGLPLAIATNCNITLLEIREKRIKFLEESKDILGLNNATVDSRDWLTFIRAKRDPVDYYIARASLQPEDLIKVFSRDPDSTIVYWASEIWEPSDKIKDYIVKDFPYNVGERERRLVFLKKRK